MTHLDKRICIDVPDAGQYTIHYVRYPVLTKGKVYDLIQSITNFWDDKCKSDLVFYDDLGYCHVYDHYKDYFISVEEWRNSKLDSVLD